MEMLKNCLAPGDPLPSISGATSSQSRFVLDTSAGRFMILACYGSLQDNTGKTVLQAIQRLQAYCDDTHLPCFGISIDPEDARSGDDAETGIGIRHFRDHGGEISRLCRLLPEKCSPDISRFSRCWILVDPGLHIHEILPMSGNDAGFNLLQEKISSLPHANDYAGMQLHAPVTIIPSLFELDLCQELIAFYHETGGTPSGFMRDVDGKTVSVNDPKHKRRDDCIVSDQALRKAVQQRIMRRVVPAVKRSHQFDITRMERYLIGCYDSAVKAHFRPHRDNTTKGTAHRRFALSVNLNDEFSGGELYFPEYGMQHYRAPPGGGIVFSCSLMHAVSPVRTGMRFAFLPFLYDEAASAIRESNNKSLGSGIQKYQSES